MKTIDKKIERQSLDGWLILSKLFWDGGLRRAEMGGGASGEWVRGFLMQLLFSYFVIYTSLPAVVWNWDYDDDDDNDDSCMKRERERNKSANPQWRINNNNNSNRAFGITWAKQNISLY